MSGKKAFKSAQANDSQQRSRLQSPFLTKASLSDPEFLNDAFIRIRNGEELRSAVIEHYAYLSKHMRTKFSRLLWHKPDLLDDVEQVALLGVINAVDRFDPEKGFKFETFATSTMIGEIKRWMRDTAFFSMTKRKHSELIQKINRVRKQLLKQSEDPTLERIAYEIAKEKKESPTKKDVKKIFEMVEEAELMSFIISLDAPTSQDNSDGDDRTLEDKLEAKDDNKSTLLIQSEFLSNALSRLSEFEYEVIRLYYFENLSQVKIAKIMGCSQMQIFRTKEDALKKMKKYAQNIDLNLFED